MKRLNTAEVNQGVVTNLTNYVKSMIGSEADVDVCRTICKAALPSAINIYEAGGHGEFDEDAFTGTLEEYIDGVYYDQFFDAIFATSDEMKAIYDSIDDPTYQQLIDSVGDTVRETAGQSEDGPLGSHVVAYGGDVIDFIDIAEQVNND